MSYYVLDEGR